jgi:ribosomal protein L19
MSKATKHKGRTLLNHIDAEERNRIEATREYALPDYRSGDILEVTLFNSISEGTYNTFTGVVFSNKYRNNLRHAFKINALIESVNTAIMCKVHSPLMGKVSLVTYGSNKNPTKMNYIPKQDRNKNRMKEAVVKGKGYKHRDEIGANKVQAAGPS